MSGPHIEIAAVRCRPAREADQPRLAQLWAETRRRSFHWLPAAVLARQDFAECETAGVTGFIAVWEPDRFVHHVFVHPNHQRRGIGGQLLDSLRDWLPPPYRLKCSSANTAALRFYAARGWREIDRGADETGSYLVLELV